jgi:hypothetical protein
MKRNRGRGTAEEERAVLAANKATDAYNAGYRRGSQGLPKGGRYQYRPEFEQGYADGERART